MEAGRSLVLASAAARSPRGTRVRAGDTSWTRLTAHGPVQLLQSALSGCYIAEAANVTAFPGHNVPSEELRNRLHAFLAIRVAATSGTKPDDLAAYVEIISESPIANIRYAQRPYCSADGE